tara:strand:- start:491 stop:631 length:141 start_codon:yes stop_codon:yes gene_type:complete
MEDELDSDRRSEPRLRRQSTRTAMVVWAFASIAGWATIVLIGLALF